MPWRQALGLFSSAMSWASMNMTITLAYYLNGIQI